MGGSQTRAPLYIEDAVGAYIHAEKIARIVNLRTMIVSGESEISITDLAGKISNIMKSDITILEQEENRRKTEIMRSYVNLDQTFKQFGWRPAYDLNDGLERTIEQIHNERMISSALAAGSSTSSLNL